jgi:methionyl-tRNA formyltransferase
MGTPEFSVPSLDTLIRNGYAIAAVVTAPDKPRGRGRKVTPTPVKEVALRHGLPLLQPESLKDPLFSAALRALTPDLIIVVAFRILPKEIFTLPRLGAFNLHASLLPKYRGAAPINWAIINGETRTGVTTFFLEEKVDTGGILLQAEVPINPEDDAGTLHDRLARVGADVVLDTVRLIERCRYWPKVQDHTLASPAPKIFKEDCRIRWDQPAERVRNHVRGLSPSPAAFTEYRGKVLKIFRVAFAHAEPLIRPGELHVSPTSLHVSAADAQLVIQDLQLEGRKRMTVEEFLRGYHPQTGEKFV